MSNDLTMLSNNLPEELRQQLADQVANDLSRLGAVGGKDSIRVTQDKKFELPNGDTHDELEAVIVDFVYRNEFYVGAFNRKQISPPACFAINASSSGLVPSDNSPVKQAENCSVCQQNQFGSSPTGDGKACKNTVYMAVLPPDADEDSPIWVIKTSPTAVKHFNNHVAKVLRTAQVPIDAVVTKVFFDPNSSYASLRFDAVAANENYGVTSARKDEARARLLQEPDVSTFEMPSSTK